MLDIAGELSDGFAAMAGLTRTMRVLATSGQDWAERTGRPASHMPTLTFFTSSDLAHEPAGAA